MLQQGPGCLYTCLPLLLLLLQTLVCGDSGNDIDMFCHPSILGCCVGNAHEVLKAFLRKAQRQSQGPQEAVADSLLLEGCPSTQRQDTGGETDDEPFFLKELTPTQHVRPGDWGCMHACMHICRYETSAAAVCGDLL